MLHNCCEFSADYNSTLKTLHSIDAMKRADTIIQFPYVLPVSLLLVIATCFLAGASHVFFLIYRNMHMAPYRLRWKRLKKNSHDKQKNAKSQAEDFKKWLPRSASKKSVVDSTLASSNLTNCHFINDFSCFRRRTTCNPSWHCENGRPKRKRLILLWVLSVLHHCPQLSLF